MRDTLVTIKVSQEERDTWKAYASRQGKPLGRIFREYIESCIQREPSVKEAAE